MADISLDGVTWRRPGVLEVLVSQKFLSRAAAPGVVDYRPVFDGPSDLRLVESYTRFEGVSSRKVCKYQSAMPLSSPSAIDGEDAEREVWSANVALNQRDIVLHPNLAAILKAGWGSVYGSKVAWPRMIYREEKKFDAETGSIGSERVPAKNPYYGTTSYFAPRIEISRERYLETGGAISGETLNGIGWLARDVGGFPFAGGQKFVLAGNSILRARGRRVLKTVWTSDPAFPEEVYDNSWGK